MFVAVGHGSKIFCKNKIEKQKLENNYQKEKWKNLNV